MRIALAVLLVLAAGGLAFESAALSQAPAGSDKAQRYLVMSRKAETAGLAESYKGVTAHGTPQPGLYSIRSTGVTTEPVRKAAVAFLASLTDAQRAKTVFPVDDDEWRKWMNQHFYVRQGVGFVEMNGSQRDAAFSLMRAALSAKGLKLSRDIMHLNETLGELNHNNFEDYGEWLYYVTVMGTPSSKEPWGFQVDGHHLIINYFVLGDQVVMSPFFVGSEPVIATSGKYKGTEILQDEQNHGLALLRSLNPDQRAKAVLNVSKTGDNNVGEAFKDNVVLDYAGSPVSGWTPAQKKLLSDLVYLYISNMDEGHARVKMDEVRQHLDETYFAWIGGSDDTSVFYYRIHSPVVLIEFDHQLPVGLRHLAANPKVPGREHVHVVVRTPNGNDYGKDLLRQHYLEHPHPHAH